MKHIINFIFSSPVFCNVYNKVGCCFFIMFFSFESGKFGLGNAAYIQFRPILLKELLFFHGPDPAAASSFCPMSTTSEQTCRNGFKNVISHIGLGVQNCWLCAGDLYLVETEDGLYIFVSCIQVIEHELNLVILLQ